MPRVEVQSGCGWLMRDVRTRQSDLPCYMETLFGELYCRINNIIISVKACGQWPFHYYYYSAAKNVSRTTAVVVSVVPSSRPSSCLKRQAHLSWPSSRSFSRPLSQPTAVVPSSWPTAAVVLATVSAAVAVCHSVLISVARRRCFGCRLGPRISRLPLFPRLSSWS